MAGLEGYSLDRYELERLIGRGGMADVYEAYDPHFDRSVAIKVFKRDDEDLLRRFIQEAHLMASLRNPHLVPIYDTGESLLNDNPYYYIVMPLLEGGTLRGRIREGQMPLSEICRNMREIGEALDYIHRQGIIHRDIKASNVLLDTDGHCYLSDFGIARVMSESTQLTNTGNVLGTVDYIAPELFEANGRATKKSDLYSLGVLLFEMVAGRVPFTAENQIALITMHMTRQPPSPRAFRPQLSAQVERVVLHAMEKRPEKRFATATDMALGFCRAASNKATPADMGMTGQTTVVMPQNSVRSTGEQQTVRNSGPQPLRLRSGGETPAFVPRVSAAPPQTPPSQPSYIPGQYPGSPYEDYPPQLPVRRRSSVLVGFLVFLALLIVTSGLAYAVVFDPLGFRSSPPVPASTAVTVAPTATPTIPPATPTPNATATAQVKATATATVQTKATASAVVATTATVQAKASATPGVIGTATTGTPLYADGLTNPNNPATANAKWVLIPGHCEIAGDGFHVKENLKGFKVRGCHESALNYQNLSASVDMTITSGHTGGFVFRLNTPLEIFHGYLFEVDAAGNYRVSNFDVTAKTIQNWTPSDALKKGADKNTLQVIAKDQTLLFYANGTFLTAITDNTYTSGTIGFLATATDAPADVVFSNLKIYQQ